MANKKSKATGNPATVRTAPAVAKTPPASRKTNTSDNNNSFINKYEQPLIVGGIALVTFLFYSVCLGNKLTNWDDLGYIISNPLIRDSSWEGIKQIFSTDNPVMGNYHPLTILLYAIEFHYKGLEPWIYHFDSVVLHVLVTVAVYYFVKALTKRTVAAAVTALLFGLHPMHVESVAWAAGRKDLLYGLFFIMSLTTYVFYVRDEGKKKTMWYVAGLALFAISLLAKSVAVSLPVTLFLIDYLEGRKWSIKIIIEKLPHFGLAVLFGILSIFAQKKIGALASLDVSFNPLERLALGAYALCTYLWKAIAPAGLSNFYPYPLKENNALPYFYYIYLAIAVGLIFALWRFGRKSKVVLFGIGFFIVNIFLLLQFLPVGGAIISDRYGYIPYLGLFFLAGWYVSEYFQRKEKMQTGKAVLGAAVAYSLILGFVTTERCKDWHDSISLWNDDMQKHPEAPVAYFYLGQDYDTKFEEATDPKEKAIYRDSAYYYFVKAIEHKPDYLNALICLGELQRAIGQIPEAKITYDRAMKINDKNESVYLGLGIVHTIMKQFDSADYFFRTAIKLKNEYSEAHSNYANFLDITGKTDASLKEYAIAIAQKPEAYIPYMNRARIYLMETKDYDKAIADYTKAIELKPEMGEPYYLRSRCYASKGDKVHALQDVEKAVALGYPKVDQGYVQQLKQ
jgi:protein O-mannosyl-transferase